ncbi:MULTISPECIES: hypothetical protein [Streptomyces]|nr:hypothetical protein [Streptomyces sp. NBC_00365]MCX5097793.1 hypothetical protein [Streptomyces sp. NBC_00365]
MRRHDLPGHQPRPASDGRAVETADIVVPDPTWEVSYEFAVDPPQPG